MFEGIRHCRRRCRHRIIQLRNYVFVSVCVLPLAIFIIASEIRNRFTRIATRQQTRNSTKVAEHRAVCEQNAFCQVEYVTVANWICSIQAIMIEK